MIEYFEVSLVRETACLMLKKGNELIDSTFINHFELDSMNTAELMEEAKELANKNNLTHYAINLN